MAPKYGAAGPLEADVLPSHTGATVLSGPQRHFLAYSLYAGSNAQLFNVPWQSMVGLIPCADSMPGDKAPPNNDNKKRDHYGNASSHGKNPAFRRLKILKTLRRFNFTLQSNGAKFYLPSICALLFKQFGPFESPSTVQVEYPE